MSAKQVRQGTRMCVKREMDKISSIIQEESTVGVDGAQLELSISKLSAYQAKFDAADSAVLAGITETAKIEEEILAAAQYNDEVMEILARAQILLSRMESKSKLASQSPQNGDVGEAVVTSKFSQLKLPKLEISSFSGETLEWQPFWDSFESAVHKNPALSVIDKFNYLRGLLTGDALRVIEGYRITAANYNSVVSALQERYGNEQTAIFAHFEAMLSLPQATYDIVQLQSVCDACERHIRSLVALGLEESTFGQVFTPILLSKLPKFVKIELHRKNGSQTWSLSNLREWLKDEIRAREQGQRAFGESRSTNSNDQSGSKADGKTRQDGKSFSSRSKLQSPTASALVSDADSKQISCFYCGEFHYSDQCTKYGDVKSRREKLQNNCLSCLKTGHRSKDCSRKIPCFHCRKKGHHRSLCFTKFGSKEEKRNVSKSGESNLNVDAAPFQPQSKRTIMQTALATLVNEDGSHEATGRLLFDTAGSRSFITTQKQAELNFPVVSEESVSIAGFQSKKRRTSTFKIVEFSVRCLDGSHQKVTASVVPSITCPIQKIPLDPSSFPALKGVKLSEPIVSEPEFVGIDVLIGLDFYYDFVGAQRIQCHNGPLLLESSLGYIATGRVVTSAIGAETIAVMLLNSAPKLAAGHTNFELERYWNLEDIGVKESVTNHTGDDEALQFHSSTLKRDVDGRYLSKWPWKTPEPDLPDNFQVAYGRLRSLLRQLKQNPKLFQSYSDIIDDQLAKGIIEPVPQDETSSNPVYYVPHHCVVTPTKSTTKVRVVYDASSKARKDLQSVNECLHRGPVLLEDLCGILIRFRLKKVALVSDIEKAFLQIGLQDSDRDVTRFLWVANPDLPPDGPNLLFYRFCRVPFGFISSPFILENTVREHLVDVATPVAEKISNDRYVDNVATGEDDDVSAVAHYQEAKKIFESARMNLREWYTNSDVVRSAFLPADLGKDEEPKVLGLRWNVVSDTLSCDVPATLRIEDVTKRVVLQQIARVYDPLGFFAPITLNGKMFVQSLWKSGFSWDEVLPEPEQLSWKKIVRDLAKIPEWKISRFVSSISDGTVELHAFCDASAKACAAAIYMRSVRKDEVVCRLLMSKTRLAPTKLCPTIPRLELIAVVIGSRLLSFVQEQLRVGTVKRFLWTDSKCTLHWIKNDRTYATFVKNRVDQIRKQGDITFGYVPSGDNPADLPSRGCNYEALKQSECWSVGPQWLQDTCSVWPKFEDAVATINEEEVVVASEVDIKMETVIDETRFSNLNRLLRATAYVFRFVNNIQKARKDRTFGVLSTEEVQHARNHWSRVIQAKYFPDLVKFQGTVWPKGIGRQLNLFRDSEDILRSCGRIEAADVSYDVKYPILLPKSSHFTDLVVNEAHARLIHSGVAQTLAEVRKRFWIINGRSVVKRNRRKCRYCRLFEGPSCKVPAVPPLPEARLSEAPPFSYVGLDYLGPLFVKSKQGSNVKVWICLYTCMVVRAVFLDVVDDMSSEQFLLSLRRFVSAYGSPRLIVSDNASQFQKVQKFIAKEWMIVTKSDDVQNFVVKNGIRWSFIVEFAPWMGGFYERLVGVVKRALRKSLGCSTVTPSELRTVVCEITAVVNSRPLVYVEDELSSEPLTPSHFVANHTVSVLPQSVVAKDSDYVPVSAYRADLVLMWRRLQGIVQKFWDSWRLQYLASLRERHVAHKQRHSTECKLTIGSVVQIKDNMPRMQWKLGRIETLHVSKDNEVRSASIRLANGRIIKRPLKLLFPLEVSDNPDLVDSEAVAPDDSSQETRRPQRRAAVVAQQKILKLNDDSSQH